MVRTRGDDADEQRVIDDVRDHGWHLICIEEDEEGPGFVYSVGMFHTLGHPEIIIFGLDSIDTMAQIVNVIGDEVRDGRRYEDWHESDTVLDGCNCLFRSVAVDKYPEYLGYAVWFYRPDTFPALQCVWADRDGRYPWQPDCHPEVRRRQPILAQASDWPFSEPKNRAVFATAPVVEEDHPILMVVHDEEGEWQFLCGTTNESEDCRLVGLGCIVENHPAVNELADLPAGWQAERGGPDQPWQRAPIQ